MNTKSCLAQHPCCFCLSLKPNMSQISTENIEDLANIFEGATGEKPINLKESNQWYCKLCKDNLTLGAKIRSQFLSINNIQPNQTNNTMKHKLDLTQTKTNSNIQINRSNIFNENADSDIDFVHDETTDDQSLSNSSAEKIIQIETEKENKNTAEKSIQFIDVDGRIESTNYNCLFCDLYFNTKNDLKSHIGELHAKRSPVNFLVASKNEILTKIEICPVKDESSSSDGLFRCAKCNSNCSEVDIEEHSIEIENLPKCNQNICENELISNPASKPEQLYPKDGFCSICNKYYERTFQGHLWRHKNQSRFSCDICKKTFPKISDIKTHMTVHSGVKPFKCEICEAGFASQTNLRNHRRKHISDDYAEVLFTRNQGRPVENQVKCLDCNITYHYRSTLNQHRREVHGENIPWRRRHQSNKKNETLNCRPRISCSYCRKSFLSAMQMRTHLVNVHKAPEAWEQICTMTCLKCFKIFDDPKLLDEHKIQVHRPYECVICKCRFATEDTMLRHALLHKEKDRNFICNLCGSAQLTKSNLKQHIRRTHTNYRPHVCQICSKGFSQGFELKSHIQKVHEKKRQYKCDLCGKTFLSSQLKASHLRSHLQDYRYKCIECLKPFYTSTDYIRHINTYH